MAWPQLREELSLHSAPAAADGSPTWSLHDPARNQFFRINWPVFEILSRWGLEDGEKITEAINAQTALELGADDFEEVIEFLVNNQLVNIQDMEGLAKLSEMKKRGKKKWASWLLHNYLFFRLPLVKPNAFLESTYPKVEWLYSRWVGVVIVLSGLLGLYFVGRQWDAYISTFSLVFTPAGLFGYFVTVVLVKAIHELGHAYTAKRYGCRIPSMGVAFLVLFPMLYTDVNESWKLPSRKSRLAVGFGGMAIELSIACLATLAWTFLPDGTLRNAMFVLSSATWISTLFINLNPFMRFDGYFLMSDWLEIPNLHQRSFAMGRWWLREKLFGLGLQPPEIFSATRQRGLIIFAVSIWIYRLVLFLGIAVLVYHFFIKALGIILFIAEIGWFVFLPVAKEVGVWWKNRAVISKKRRSWFTFGLLGFAVLLMAFPLDTRISAQAILRGGTMVEIFAPSGAEVVSIDATVGQKVNAGQRLLRLRNPDVDSRLLILDAKVKSTEMKLSAASFDRSLHQRNLSIRKTLLMHQAERSGLRKDAVRYDINAGIEGQFFDLRPDIISGQWVGENERLGVVVDHSRLVAEVFLSEQVVIRVHEGDKAIFYPEDPAWPLFEGTVQRIDRFATKALKQPALASIYGGKIPVHEKDGALVPDRAIYRVILTMEKGDKSVEHFLRGDAVVLGSAESLIGRAVRFALAVLIRESGF